MPDRDDLPPVWKPEPVKLVVVEHPEPDEEEDLQQMLDAIRAAKDADTELTTDEAEAPKDHDQC